MRPPGAPKGGPNGRVTWPSVDVISCSAPSRRPPSSPRLGSPPHPPPPVIASARLGSAAPAQMLKISHQFPGGTIDEGDFRDRVCLKFAAELEKRTGGEIGGEGYPQSPLMKNTP